MNSQDIFLLRVWDVKKGFKCHVTDISVVIGTYNFNPVFYEAASFCDVVCTARVVVCV